MEINKTRAGKGSGSFGIPPHMQDQMDRMAKTKKSQTEIDMSEEEAPKADFMDGDPITDGTPAEPEKKSLEVFDRDLTAEEVLKSIGVDFTDEDFQKLLFKGYVDKEVEVTKFKGKAFTAQIKTLTAEEYDMIDEILTEELKEISMSPQGYDARRSIMIGSFAITKILGKPICKEVKDSSGEIDRKGMAHERRKVLKSLAPPLLNKIMEMQNALTVATNLIIREPGAYGKNS